MFRVSLDPKSQKAFIHIENSGRAAKEGVRQAFYKLGKDLKATANKLILDGPKTGRTYLIRIGGRLKRHQASAPGEAPANLTGNLRKSIGFDVRGSESMEFGSRSGPPAAGISPKQNVAAYSKYLEVGSSKIAPRPYLKPSIEENSRNAIEHFTTEITRQLDK